MLTANFQKSCGSQLMKPSDRRNYNEETSLENVLISYFDSWILQLVIFYYKYYIVNLCCAQRNKSKFILTKNTKFLATIHQGTW